MSTRPNFFQSKSNLKNPFDVLVTPTYNLAEYGKDLFIPLSSAGVSTTTFDNSTATILRNTFTDPNSITGEEIDDYPTVIANEDTLLMWHAGNDTDYDRVFRYNPDAKAVLSKIYMNIAFILNISSFTSGSVTFDTVTVTVTERANDSGVGDRIVYSNVFPTGHNALGAATADIFILSDVFGDINLEKNLPLDFRFQIGTTELAASTLTFQTGIVPFFAYNAVTAVKPYSLSGLGMHLNTDFDNGQAVIRKAGVASKGYFLNQFGVPQSFQ